MKPKRQKGAAATGKSIPEKANPKKRTWNTWGMDLCPVNPEHGVLLDTEGASGMPLLMCPHVDHSRSLSRYFWTTEELKLAKLDVPEATARPSSAIPAEPGKRKVGATS